MTDESVGAVVVAVGTVGCGLMFVVAASIVVVATDTAAVAVDSTPTDAKPLVVCKVAGPPPTSFIAPTPTLCELFRLSSFCSTSTFRSFKMPTQSIVVCIPCSGSKFITITEVPSTLQAVH